MTSAKFSEGSDIPFSSGLTNITSIIVFPISEINVLQ